MSEQLTLFDEIEKTGISIIDASKKADVSSATIRNWIKTKYLDQLSNGLISIDSLYNFLNNVAGSEKLNSRANKSLKDNHNHSELSDEILSKLKDNDINLFNVGNEYENSLSDSYRNKEGIYYTPLEIVKDLLKDFCELGKSNLTFCDPSCGSGNFIMEAIEIGFKPENIFGFDTDPIVNGNPFYPRGGKKGCHSQANSLRLSSLPAYTGETIAAGILFPGMNPCP